MFSSAFTFLKQPSSSLFLDVYPGASHAYSISRRLSSSYTGSLIRIKDADTGAEKDIGYDVNGSLDTAEILSSVSGGTAYVMSVYDQSSNGNTLNYAASFPTYIIRAGVIDASGGIPGSFTDGIRSYFRLSGGGSITAKTVVSVNQQTVDAVVAAIGFNGSPTNQLFVGGTFSDIDGIGLFDGTNFFNSSEGGDFSRHVAFFSLNGSGGARIGVDGNPINTFSGVAINDFNLSDVWGRDQGSLCIRGYRHEFIAYPTDQSANYAGMITEMRKFY